MGCMNFNIFCFKEDKETLFSSVFCIYCFSFNRGKSDILGSERYVPSTAVQWHSRRRPLGKITPSH